MKKRKNKYKKNITIDFLLHLKTTQDICMLIPAYRKTIPSSKYEEFFSWVYSKSHFKNKIISSFFPTTLSDSLGRVSVTSSFTLKDEISWAEACLPHFVEKLTIFSKLSQNFQCSLLKSDITSCEITLNTIEKEFGQSVWLIKNKIPFLQKFKGLEAQKKFCKQIMDNTKNPLIYMLVYFLSYRNEETVTYKDFTETISSKFSLKSAIPAKNYLHYHLLPNVSVSVKELANILLLESTGSMVDYYEALIWTVRVILSTNINELKPIVEKVLVKLQHGTTDTRISSLLLESTNMSSNSPITNNSSVEAFSFFLKGNYSKALNIAEQALETDPINPDLIEIVARSQAILDITSVENNNIEYHSLISNLRSVIINNDKAENSLNSLRKTALNFHSSFWADSLISIIEKEISSNPIELAQPISHFSTSGNPKIHPIRISAYSNESLQKFYATTIKSYFPTSLSTVYSQIISEEDISYFKAESFDKDQQDLLKAIIMIKKKQYDISYNIAKNLYNSRYYYYRIKAIKIIIHCLIELKRINEVVDYTTSIFFKEPYLYRILPLKEIISYLDKITYQQLTKNLSLSIILDLYSRFIDKSNDARRNYAYEDFLIANGIERPSQLKQMRSKFDEDKLVYYLKYICIESVMDNSIIFESSQDVLKERLEVCRLLIDIDDKHSEIYQTEIKEILSKLTIQKRRREIEQSKIYIDIENIKKVADKLMKELYKRYISLPNISINSLFFKDKGKLIEKKDYTFIVVEVEKVISEVFSNSEKTNLFNSMIMALRDIFVSSTEYGLDGYLSVRIRHGTLSGELRKPLEAVKLITQVDSLTNQYRPNEYLIKLDAYGNFITEKLSERFARFSEEFDSLVQKIINQWLQIKKEDKEEGLFDFRISSLDLLNLSERINKESSKEISFEDFLDIVLNFLDKKLNDILIKIREKFQTEIKNEITKLLDLLQEDVNKILFKDSVGELNVAINKARTELQVVCNRVSEWFYLTISTTDEPFFLEDAIDIGVDTIKRSVSQNFKVKYITCPKQSIKIQGKHLSCMVDIFFIIFENITRHSGMFDSPLASITVSINNEHVRIMIENSINKSIKTKDAQEKILKIKSAMKDNKNLRFVSSEGGSGFHKIWKLLKYDLGLEPKLDFNFRADNNFFVECFLESKVLKL